MSVTINAHQLGRLIDKVRGHIGSEYTPVLHGIRLDVDSTYLHAVATDRYTVAVARYRHDGEQNGEPLARTIPAPYLCALREWIGTQEGQHSVTISTEAGRLVFATPHTEMRIPVTDSQEFPDWRGLLRSVVNQPGSEELFPALNPGFLARWAAAGDNVRVRIAAEDKAIAVFAGDFIGAQMPTRYSGVGPIEQQTFGEARTAWGRTLQQGAEGLDMATDMLAEDKPRYEAASTIPDMVESFLQQTLRSTTDSLGAPSTDPGAIASFALAGVHAWSAYRLLNALHQADPRLAAQTVAELSDELDAGDFSESAWDIAIKAGHDPVAWRNDYEAHLKKLAEKRATEQNAA
ncbi:DNA polymerase III subunit beta family protein [Streptomyces sp. NPDC002540]